MKSTAHLILLGLLIHSFSFGQTVTNYGPFPKMFDDVYNFNLPEGSKIKKVDFNPELKKYLIESLQNKMLTFSVVGY